ncbi:hypothetical protein L2E82_27632 [Cichorium intybus]|uniref:Uncharacterized protein n=1 Tax=Cichorium intybus TaxID=13427 RepID=A0ACB9CTV8_CICIN|nr:hypothetical protein L2E82_27632 [Cichorium intybus]
MGCSQSRIENKEALNQCKERKAFMKQSISAHYAYAAAHSAYAAALKNTGAALSDYAQGVLQFPDHTLRLTPHPDSSRNKPHLNTIVGKINNEGDKVADNGLKHRNSYKSSVYGSRGENRSGNFNLKRERGNENVPHPPPPPGNDGILPWDFFFTSMEEVVRPSLVEVDDISSKIGKPDIQRTMTDDQGDHGGGGEIKSGGGAERAVVESEEEPSLLSMKENVQSMNLLQVIKELNDGFVKASQNAHKVSKILEANNFGDNSGHTDHSTRVTRVTKWNRSFKGQQIVNNEKDDYTAKEKQTHSMILDKILAWEKKLHDEVKAGEDMKYVYKKKIASVNKLTKGGASGDSVQTKAMVSHLHTRCIVQMQSIDSTVSEINRLRDEQLYPKLVRLVEEMGAIWKNMRKQHENQLKMVQSLRAIKISLLPNETNEHNFSNTKRLHFHVKMWCSEFQKLTLHQHGYIKSLNKWLKLSLISIDNNFRDEVSSPRKSQNPKILSLLRTWQDQLEKLPEVCTKTAINTFADAIDTIVHYQSEEMQMKEKCEETRREITRKSRKFEEWCDKYMAKRTPTDEKDLDVVDDIEVIAEHQIAMEALEQRLEEEEEAYRQQCGQVKDKSLMNLNIGMSEIVAAMSGFSLACSHLYESLKFHSTRQNLN